MSETVVPYVVGRDDAALEDDPCAACGAEPLGPFCHACGERRPRSEDERLWPFLRDQFHEVTSADGRLWRSVRALSVPGRLTEEHFAGRRGLYLRPVRLFLVVNVVFFLVLSLVGGNAVRGGAQEYRGNFDFGSRMDRAAVAEGVDPGTYDVAFGQRAGVLAPSMIGVFVPLFAALFTLVLAPLRRSVVRHVVFAAHAVTALMCILVVLTGVVVGGAFALSALGVWQRPDSLDPVLIPLVLVSWITYLTVGLRRAYGAPWVGAAAAGLVLGTVGTVVVFWLYRAVLFFVTLWTLDVPA